MGCFCQKISDKNHLFQTTSIRNLFPGSFSLTSFDCSVNKKGMNQLSVLLILFTTTLIWQCVPSADDEFDPADPFAAAENDLGDWNWIPVAGMECRDGSASGMGVRLRENASRLVIYLEGGGACFNETTCKVNPESFSGEFFFLWKAAAGRNGLFNTSNPLNPLKEWNAVYVPYCTGDIHGGNQAEPGAEEEKNFVGFSNMEKVLALIAPYFNSMEEVLLCGTSAGGYGATLNYEQVATAFSGTPVHLLNDSGPFLEEDAALSPCLQQLFRNEFGLNENLPADCTSCFGTAGDGLSAIYPYYSARFPDAHMGLISYQEDQVIRQFFGYGVDSCANLDGPFVAYPDTVFANALLDLREEVLSPGGNWSTFFPAGDLHGVLTSGRFYNETIDGVSIASWVTAMLEGEVIHLSE
jgi:hypothetical protein